MAISRIQLEDQATLIVGETHDPRIDVHRIIENAGMYLFSMHPWGWRRRPPVALDFIANQSWVTLPLDFGLGKIVGVSMNDNVTYRVQTTTLSDVEFRRSTTILSPSFYYVAPAWAPQETSTSAMVARLEVYPTPTSEDIGAMSLTYMAGWTPLTHGLHVANIPTEFDHLLIELVRAFAAYERTQDHSHVDAVDQWPTTIRLKQADGSVQANLGYIMGGAGQSGQSSGSNWNFTTAGLG